MMVDKTLELLGVSVVGPPPLGRLHLRLEEAGHLWVLYGLNGAGKTRLLRALEEALTGRRTENWLGDPLGHRLVHVKVHAPADEADSVRSRLRGGHGRRLLRSLSPSGSPPTEALGAALRREYENASAELAAEVVAQGVFTLEAGAGPPDPNIWPSAGAQRRWGVHLAACCEGETPALRALLGPNVGYLDVPALRGARFDDFSGGPVELAAIALDRGDDPAPAWVPAPLVDCGMVDLSLCTVLTDGSVDVVGIVEQAAADACRDPDGDYDEFDLAPAPVLRADGGAVAFAPEAIEVITKLEDGANNLLKRWFPAGLGFGDLRCQLRAPAAWPSVPSEWGTLDDTATWVPLEEFSHTQQRWARLAIGLVAAATIGRVRGPVFVLIDEPELGLHPRAAEDLADGLASFAESSGASVIVATHSPAFLNVPSARLLHVRRSGRDRGPATIAEITQSNLGALKELGLSPAELLQSYRRFLFVEGQHDRLVLETLLGDELARARTKVFEMRGAKQAKSVVEAQVLLELSPAPLLVALDNDQLGRFEAAFAAAKNAGQKGEPPAKAFDDAWGADKRGDERLYLRELAVAAVAAGNAERISVFGFSKKDILWYLPAAAFKKGATGWDQLEEESGGKSGEAFKAWLATQGLWDRSASSLESIARTVEDLHPDFYALVERLR